uniref:Uncharacterized protein n=1 Tax=Ciona savignyi TaxID=51511 RepID=H2ZCW2_CIOSA
TTQSWPSTDETNGNSLLNFLTGLLNNFFLIYFSILYLLLGHLIGIKNNVIAIQHLNFIFTYYSVWYSTASTWFIFFPILCEFHLLI